MRRQLPRGIVLCGREDVQLDLGTPVVAPQPVNWSTSQL